MPPARFIHAAISRTLPAVLAAAAITAGCTDVATPRLATDPASSRVASPSLPPPADSPEIQPRAPEAVRNGRLEITLGECRQAGCVLDFDFSLPMIEAEDLAAADLPDVVFHPPVAGELRWMSPTRLSFTPASGALGWGHRVEITIPRAVPLAGDGRALAKTWIRTVRVPYFQVAEKVANWPVIEGQPRFVAFLGWHLGRIGRGPLYLLFDQPVSLDPGASEPRAVEIEVTGVGSRPVRARLFHPGETLHVPRGEIAPGHLVAVELADRPADGERIRVRVKGTPGSPSQQEEFVVDTSFELLGQGLVGRRRGSRVPLETTWQLTFSDPFEPALLEKLLRIEPEPLEAEVSGWAGRAEVKMTLAPGTSYTMTLDPAFTDVLGNPLEEPAEIAFQSEDLPAFLEMPRAPILAESSAPRIPMRGRNIAGPAVEAFSFDSPRALVRALAQRAREGTPSPSCVNYGFDGAMRWMPADDVPAGRNVALHWEQSLDAAPGLWCVEARAGRLAGLEVGKVWATALVQSTNLSVTAKVFDGSLFAWVTRLADASPVAGARLSVLDAEGSSLGEATAADDGTVTVAFDAGRWQAKKGAPPLFVLAEERFDGGTVDRVAVPLDPEHLSSAWQFGLTGEAGSARVLRAALWSDRGVYRPGEIVHLKALVHEDALTAAGSRGVTLEVSDPRGQQVTAEELVADAYGGVDLEVELGAQAPVGAYKVLARVDTGGEGPVQIKSHAFRVEEYRVPTFQVRVEDRGSGEGRGGAAWQPGREVQAELSARYLHGGLLSGRAVTWKVVRQPHRFAPAGFERFLFAVAGGARPAASVAHGEGRLDERGRLGVAFTPDHPATAGALRYTLEATVTDVDRQAYAGRLSRVVHPAAFYVGLLPPPRQILKLGEPLTVPVVALTPEGEPLAGVEVRVRLERVDHHTAARLAGGSRVQHLNRAVTVAVEDCDVVSGETAAECVFELGGLDRAGFYRVRAWARDREHRVAQSAFSVTLSGDRPAAWPRFDLDQVELVADRPSYHPGDVARLVVQTPFEHARGLLTIERDRVLEHRLFTLDGGTPVLEVPITGEHAPNVFVSAVLLRGREHFERDATGFETGAPGFKIGYAELAVEPVEQRLDVELRAPRRAAPGTVLEVDLAVRDAAGRPSAGQATVMVVDEAVLGMTAYRTPDPVSGLYVEKPLAVRTAEGRLELTHAKRERRERLFPGGDGGDGPPLDVFLDFPRGDFESTAYWNPAVPIGPDGTARVEVRLPDNTTTFRLMAVVVDGEQRAGSGERRVVVKKPLMVRPVLPRFVYPGDELRIEAQIYNGSGEGGEVTLAAELIGLERVGPPAETTRWAGPGDTVSFPLRVRVTGRDRAHVFFAARLGEHGDGVEMGLPILEPGLRRTVVTSRTIADRGSVSLTLPAERLPGTAELEVVASTTALSELQDAVGYLLRYPNGCIEQTTSTAYPLVILRDLLPEIGVEVDAEKLEEFTRAGIQRILSFQTTAGGLAYWPGSDDPHAFATAFGLTALIEGKKRGYDVPGESLERMADYLEATLRRGDVTEQIPHGGMADGDTRAFFVMSLGRLGRPQAAYLETLWRERRALSAFGLSFLAIAAAEMDDQALVGPILEAVREASRESDEEAWFEGEPKGGWSFDSPLRTHASALLAYARGARSGEVGGKLLRGLLARRRGGLWGNTQENVFGIMAVHAMMGSGGSGEAPRMELAVGGRPIPAESLETVSRRVRRLRLGEDELGLRDGVEKAIEAALSHGGGPPVLLKMRAVYEVPLTAETRRARSDGFAVERHYETLEGEPLDHGHIPLGSLVRVRLRVASRERQNYVAVADLLPAGLEPLNAHLETTERVSLGELSPEAERGLTFLSYQEIRDARVAFFVDDMPPGDYEFVYVARATTPGTFLRPAAGVEAMYQPEVSGTTRIDEVTVR